MTFKPSKKYKALLDKYEKWNNKVLGLANILDKLDKPNIIPMVLIVQRFNYIQRKMYKLEKEIEKERKKIENSADI